MLRDLVSIYLSTEYLKVLETEKQLKLVATNPG